MVISLPGALSVANENENRKEKRERINATRAREREEGEMRDAHRTILHNNH